MAPTTDAAQVTLAFQAALARLSVRVVALAARWFRRAAVGSLESVPRGASELAGPAWNEGARLGIAYYRLLRALETGRTVEDPTSVAPSRVSSRSVGSDGGGESRVVQRVTIGRLVSDFERASGQKLHLRAPRSATVVVEPLSRPPAVRRDWPIATRLSDLRVVSLKVNDRLGRKVKIDPDWYQQHKESSEVFVAGVVQEAAANGARSMVRKMGEYDGRLVGWIRVSGSGRPCAFCAMQLSRGAVFKSARTATYKHGNGVDKYHPHCRCFARPIFRKEGGNDGDYSLNQRLWGDWKSLKGELGKSPSFSDWRRFYYRTYEKPRGKVVR